MKMLNLNRALMFIVLLATAHLLQLEAAFMENWNDSNAGANHWFFFNSNDQEDHGNVPLTWHGAGGIDNSPHVSCPLGNLTDWYPQTPEYAYYPLYAIEPNHVVNLIDNPLVRISVRDMDNVSLHGGGLYFFVGQWIDENDYYFAYYKQSSFTPTGAWQTHEISTTANAGDWISLGGAGSTPDMNDLLVEPQQWGFTIRGGTAAPSGTLGFDNLAVIPEPGTILLLLIGMGAVMLIRRGKRNVE